MKIYCSIVFGHFCCSQQTRWRHTTSKLQRTFRVRSQFLRPTLDTQHTIRTDYCSLLHTWFAVISMIYSTVSIAANIRIQIKINIIFTFAACWTTATYILFIHIMNESNFKVNHFNFSNTNATICAFLLYISFFLLFCTVQMCSHTNR